MKLRLMILGMFAALLSSHAFSLSWSCEGSCNSSCLRGTVMESGNSESAARSAMNATCSRLSVELGCIEHNVSAIVNRCWQIGGGTPAPTQPKQYNLVYRNNCNKHGKLWTAVYYRDLQGQWRSEGYWGLEYGETAKVGSTTNRIFFTHAHSNSNVVWGTGDTNQQVRGKNEPFTKQTIDANYQGSTYTFTFGCN